MVTFVDFHPLWDMVAYMGVNKREMIVESHHFFRGRKLSRSGQVVDGMQRFAFGLASEVKHERKYYQSRYSGNYLQEYSSDA
jgi:hypothetical protein